jgi:curli biogenesis system outer membrane secretion channel CsgG
MKDGIKFQASGMDIDAVNAFKSSLSKNMSNVASREGLQLTGQKVLNTYLDDFSRNAMMNRPKESVYAFMKADGFKKEIKKYGVELSVPDHYYQTYASTEETYLSGRYEEGIAKLEQDDFAGSKVIFDEILKVHPGYRDVESLKGTSVLEPKYRRANEEKSTGAYRRAYYLYDDILKVKNYKDVQSLKQECQVKGAFVMAIVPFENHSNNVTAAPKAHAYTLNALVNLENPFLRVVDRQNLHQILAEQNFSLSGIIDEQTAVEVGNLIGAKSLLIGSLIDYREERGRLIRSTMNGYESYTITERGEDGKEKLGTRYKSVKYNQYTDKNSVYLSFHMKLISLETGEVLLSEVIEKQCVDQINFASYAGDKKNLFPQVDGKVNTSKDATDGLQNLLNARSELEPVSTLSNQSLVDLAQSLATKVELYLNR